MGGGEGRGAAAPLTRGCAIRQGCMNFAAMSYILDLLTNRNKDPFEQALSDPSSVDKDMLTKQKTNAKS